MGKSLIILRQCVMRCEPVCNAVSGGCRQHCSIPHCKEKNRLLAVLLLITDLHRQAVRLDLIAVFVNGEQRLLRLGQRNVRRPSTLQHLVALVKERLRQRKRPAVQVLRFPECLPFVGRHAVRPVILHPLDLRSLDPLEYRLDLLRRIGVFKPCVDRLSRKLRAHQIVGQVVQPITLARYKRFCRTHTALVQRFLAVLCHDAEIGDELRILWERYPIGSIHGQCYHERVRVMVQADGRDMQRVIARELYCFFHDHRLHLCKLIGSSLLSHQRERVAAVMQFCPRENTPEQVDFSRCRRSRYAGNRDKRRRKCQ